ncbi:MAG: NAD-dependent deacylase [Thermoanaerobaculia bacterium]|nr:MAG: NAD-dependent deacylase [Thermoanaerobaculia bacterium]
MLLTPAQRARLVGAERVVIFTGAGVSQESGLGTFRGPGGMWERFRPEELATPEAFERDPERVWRWYAERFEAMRSARPNRAHETIARWGGRFPSLVVVTQNVDRLHQRAGSRDVLELHGTVWEALCARCGRGSETEALLAVAGVRLPPQCPCGGRFRPAVVWFGERLPEAVLARSLDEARRADVLLAVGTSATVWPAAGVIEQASAARALVVEINREPSALSELADVALTGAAGEILPALDEELGAWPSRP